MHVVYHVNMSDEYNSTVLHSSTNAKERCSPAVESIVTREKSGIGSSPSLANRLTNHGYACCSQQRQVRRESQSYRRRATIRVTHLAESRTTASSRQTRRQHLIIHRYTLETRPIENPVDDSQTNLNPADFSDGTFGWVDQWLSTTVCCSRNL